MSNIICEFHFKWDMVIQKITKNPYDYVIYLCRKHMTLTLKQIFKK